MNPQVLNEVIEIQKSITGLELQILEKQIEIQKITNSDFCTAHHSGPITKSKLVCITCSQEPNGYVAYFKHPDTILYSKIRFGNYKKLYYTDGAPRENINLSFDEQYDLKKDNPMSAGYLTYYILWGQSRSISENIKSYKERFNL